MPSYTPNKNLIKPASGEFPNAWAAPVNDDWDFIDRAFGGTTTLNAVSPTGTVTLTDIQYRAPIIIISGASPANTNYRLPAGVGGFWYIFNNSTGTSTITFSSAGGGGTVTLERGRTTAVICDATVGGVGVGLADTTPPAAAGSTTQVQFNSAGALGADANLTWGPYVATFTGTIAGSSSTLVTTGVTGTIRIGMTLGTITGGTFTSRTTVTILSQISGTGGGAGSYTVSQTNTGTNATVTSASFSALAAPIFLGNLVGAASTANALNASNTYTAFNYISTETGGTALQVGNNSGIRNFNTSGGEFYIDVAGGGATAGSIILRNTNAFTAMATFSGTGTQLTSLGVGTAPSGTAGEIRATNNVTAYFSSDERLKENVQPIENALGIVSAVGGKTFDWTDAYIAEHGGEDDYFVQKSDFGVIAQHVQAVFPLAVRTRQDGTLAVDYGKLVAVAFAAIAELKAEVDILRQQAVKVVK
jgi:hypothetical protein